ncbi:ATP-binding protein [Thermodesulfobacteriota bacterium]
MSRIEAGRIKLDAARFDLNGTIESVDSMMRLQADNKSLSLQIKRDADVPRYVKTDQAKLRQVLVNLLGNSIKFTERGGVILRVGCGPVPKNEASTAILSFDVEDTGPGIPESYMESIFDPFVRTDSGLSSQDGTGLGLAIPRQFVQLMGGDISVTSEVGKGSTFFHIEIEPAAAEDLSALIPFREVVGIAPCQPEYRVLVVEDNPESCALLVRLLRPLGFQVRGAANGQEGIEISEEWDSKLIFMDMRMPVMDGFEETRRIRSGSQGKKTKIVAVTASVFKHEKKLVMIAGCDDFIRKPIRSEEIFEALARHLGVRFRYAKAADEVTEETQKLDDEDVREHLRALPPEWVSRLNGAAVAGDFEDPTLLEEIRGQDSALADTIGDLLKKYRLDKVVDYTG